MAKYFLTNKAVEDLSSIWEYTLDTWSEKQADKYYELIISSCESISKSPLSGKQYEEIEEGILGRKTGKHIVFYRSLKSGDIEILRILHESMDLKSKNIE